MAILRLYHLFFTGSIFSILQRLTAGLWPAVQVFISTTLTIGIVLTAILMLRRSSWAISLAKCVAAIYLVWAPTSLIYSIMQFPEVYTFDFYVSVGFFRTILHYLLMASVAFVLWKYKNLENEFL